MTPTGTLGDALHGPEIQLTRSFEAPIGELWSTLTESDRLESWIGRWEGDPATGKLTFYMTFEGEDVAGEEYTITECNRPHHFAVDTRVGTQEWHLRVQLTEQDGTTTLLFSQPVSDDDMTNVGPGWEYYLDRLAAVMQGRDVGTVVWDDYYPAQRGYYAALVGGPA